MNLSHTIKMASVAIALVGCGAQPSRPADQASVLHGNGDGDCYQGQEFECAAEKEIFRLNNEYRANAGRVAFAQSGHMGWAARDWSKQQGARGSIGHDGFPDQRTSAYKNKFGSMEGVWVAGENVAFYGPSSGQTAEVAGLRLAQMWWNSSGHRANMLGNYDGVGIGVFKTSRGNVFGTQIFYNRQ